MIGLTTPNFSLGEAITETKPLLIFIVGMAIYSVFVFKFYQFLARKDIFKIRLQKYADSSLGTLQRFFSWILYVIEYLLLFPLFVFFWFSVLTLIISFLSKNQDFGNIMLVSMALVAAVRITAYYKEDLSRDLAKMLPFALLGVFLVDISFFSLETSLATINTAPSFTKTIFYYFVFVVMLEFVLRIAHGIVHQIMPRKRFEPQEEQAKRLVPKKSK